MKESDARIIINISPGHKTIVQVTRYMYMNLGDCFDVEEEEPNVGFFK